mmetsp:Transcript_11222/g.16794  ORF Transcript_11222/g.16794 Transcript_11222/m.16794 type:complete len:230 (+) Transcript_11222:161-850(+)
MLFINLALLLPLFPPKCLLLLLDFPALLLLDFPALLLLDFPAFLRLNDLLPLRRLMISSSPSPLSFNVDLYSFVLLTSRSGSSSPPPLPPPSSAPSCLDFSAATFDDLAPLADLETSPPSPSGPFKNSSASMTSSSFISCGPSPLFSEVAICIFSSNSSKYFLPFSVLLKFKCFVFTIVLISLSTAPTIILTRANFARFSDNLSSTQALLYFMSCLYKILATDLAAACT